MEDFTYNNSIETLLVKFPELKISSFILEGYDLEIPYSLYQGFGDLLIKRIKEGKLGQADEMIGFISDISQTKSANGHDLVLDLYETIEQDPEAEKYFLSKLGEPGLTYYKVARNWEKLSKKDQDFHRAMFNLP